jgi:hypothetical protein
MNRKNYALGKVNFILLAVGMLIVVLGFVLMAGPGSTEHAFNPDIFSVRRIKVAPVVCLIGFLSMIFAILYRPKTTDEPEDGEKNLK